MTQDKYNILQIQQLLHLPQTGKLDELTRAGIKNFQLKHKIPTTGELDDLTLELMFNHITLSSDLSELHDGKIEKYYLPSNEYYEISTNKEYIFLHHTAGWNNPYRTIDLWGSDKRGKIGTHFVIGGINPKTGDDTYDGKILQAFDLDYYAWHLGNVDKYMHKHSIGIELCNFGWVIKRNNKFYTYTNTEVDPNYVVDIGFNFRGHRYWHNYSCKQIEALEFLISYLTNKFNISTEIGLKYNLLRMAPKDAFEYSEEARHGELKGILSHSSVRPDKFDVYPHLELCDLLLKI